MKHGTDKGRTVKLLWHSAQLSGRTNVDFWPFFISETPVVRPAGAVRSPDFDQTSVGFVTRFPRHRNVHVAVRANVRPSLSHAHKQSHTYKYKWCQTKDTILIKLFDGKPSIGNPPPERCIFGKCCLWPWPLNHWPWKCHQYHADMVLSNFHKLH